jgi:hypothetical protein
MSVYPPNFTQSYIYFWNGEKKLKTCSLSRPYKGNVIKNVILECEICPLFIFLNFHSLNVDEIWNKSIKNLLEYLKEKNIVSKIEDVF